MEVHIKSCIQGAQESEGIAVIIDVFRASNTIIACLAQKAEYIIPVESSEEALKLKGEHPEYYLFAEEKGIQLKEADYGNSPAHISKLKLEGQKIILRTSAGVKGILAAKNADTVLIASFANTQAIVEYITEQNPKKVTLVAIGFESETKAMEDELCAQYIREKLKGKNPDFKAILEEILASEGADRLRELYQQEDLEFSTRIDTHDIVPLFNPATGKIINQKRT